MLEAQGTTPALGHTWDTGVVTKEPTTTETGVKTYTCGTCGITRTEDIPCVSGDKDDDNNTGDYLRGDVNMDGAVDIIDCVRLVRHLAGYEVELSLEAADVTGDGGIDSFDVVRLMKLIAGYDV